MSAHVGFAPESTERTACFSVVAAADPGVMQRVLQVFAKRGLVPTLTISRKLSAMRSCRPASMPATWTSMWRSALRGPQTVLYHCVGTVLTSEKRRALTA